MNSQQQGQQQQQIVKRPHVYQEASQQYVDTPYQHQEFPKWKYHTGKPDTLVSNRKQEKALGPGWTDDPGEARCVQAAEPAPDQLKRENEELKKEIEKLRKEKGKG